MESFVYKFEQKALYRANFLSVTSDYRFNAPQGSKCPSLPGLTHWVNPGLPGLGFKLYFGKVGNTGE